MCRKDDRDDSWEAWPLLPDLRKPLEKSHAAQIIALLLALTVLVMAFKM